MGLSVLTPAPVTALAEADYITTKFGTSAPTADEIAALIADQTDAILAVLCRDVVRQRYQETFAETGRKRLVLGQRAVDPDSVTVTIEDTALAADTFEVEDAEHGVLYRDSGWGSASSTSGHDAEHVIVVTYKAGRLLPATATRPGVVSTWLAATTYALGAWVRPAAVSLTSALRFECTTAGASHATTEPTWPTTAGGTVTDNTATWTARAIGGGRAPEMPKLVRDCVWLAVQNARTRETREAGLAGRAGDGVSESYFATHTETELPPNVLRSLARLRPWL